MTKTELLAKPDPWAIVIGIGEVPSGATKTEPAPPPAQPKPVVAGWWN